MGWVRGNSWRSVLLEFMLCRVDQGRTVSGLQVRQSPLPLGKGSIAWGEQGDMWPPPPEGGHPEARSTVAWWGS